MTNADDWNFHFDEPVAKFLDLPNGVMERICHYLPTQADKSQACLIHSTWQPAAMNVLWETPRFRFPNNLRAFVATIRISKRLALLVRDVYLVLPDSDQSIFSPVAKSNLERHQSNDYYLTNPNLINMIVKVCEKLEALTIYGWNIDIGFLENLGIMGTHITRLHIIGANPKCDTFLIHSLLSRLTSLSLDGNFKLNDAFVHQLVHRGHRLTHLQLSLGGLDRVTLKKICNRQISLEHLILTDAHNLQDTDIEEVVKSFPKLKTLCIEGAVHLTDLSLFYAVSRCTGLEELEIRCSKSALEGHPIQASFKPPQAHVTIRLQRLILENILYDDSVINCLTNSLGSLTLIGLKDCPNITQLTLASIILSCHQIQSVHISHCPNVGLDVFTEYREVTTAASLRSFYISHSGHTTPASVYHLCVSNPKLHTLSIEGYPDIYESVVGTFNTIRSKDLIVLDQKSIDALVNTSHPEFSYHGESRTLSGYQISLLADRLKLDYHELIAYMDEVAEMENNLLNGRTSVQSSVRSKVRGITSPSMDVKSGKKPLHRMAALMGETHRPDTPSLWSHDYLKNGNQFLDNQSVRRQSDLNMNTFNDTTHKSDDEEEDSDDYDDEYDGGSDNSDGAYNNDDDDDDEPEEDVDEEEEEMEDDTRDNFYDNINMPPNGKVKEWGTLTGQNSDIKLGGWGASNDASKATQIGGLTTNQMSQLDQSYPDQSNKDYVQQWREKSTADPFHQNTKRKSTTQPGMQYPENDSDGWGEPKEFVAWNDLRKQGYNAKLIEEQKKTRFWRNVGQTWDTLPTGEEVEALQYEQQDSPLPVKTTAEPVSFNSLVPSEKKAYRKRSDSCVSSTGSIDLDENGDVVLKTTTDSMNHAGSTSYRHAENTKVRGATGDWRSLKEPPAPEERSRREGITTTEISLDEVAANEWSTLATKNRFSRATKTNGNTRKPSHKERANLPPNQMAGKWGEFQQNDTVPPNRVYTPEPFRQTPEPQSPMAQTPEPFRQAPEETLIETQDTMAQQEDLLIDTSDGLDHTKPLQPTTFNSNLFNSTTTTTTTNIFNDGLGPLASKSPTNNSIKDLEEFYWSAERKPTEQPPLFVEPIVGTGHDSPNVIDDFDRLIEESNSVHTTSTKPADHDYLSDISQLMGPQLSMDVLKPDEPVKPEPTEQVNTDASLSDLLLLPTAINGTASSVDSSSVADNNEIFSTTISIETKLFGVQKITLDENSDERAVVHDFCKKYEMEDLFDKIFQYVHQTYTKKRTRKLLKNSKKKKTSSSPKV